MKRFKKSFTVFALLFCLVISLFTTPKKVYAASYNPEAAMSYAKQHWNDGVGECAEFVSRCLKAGGINVFSAGTGPLGRALMNNIGMSWTGSKTQWAYSLPQLRLNSSGYATYDANKNILHRGDVVFQWCNTHSISPHVIICSGYNSKGLATFYAHNGALNNGLYKLSVNTAYQHTTSCDMVGRVVCLSTNTSTGSSCGCSTANAGWYKVTSSNGLNVNYEHNFSTRYGLIPYGYIAYVTKANSTGGVSGTYGHINYGGREGHIAMKYMTPVKNLSEVCGYWGHDTRNKTGYPSTCTSPGLTDGSYCARCQAELTKQNIINPTGHSYKSEVTKQPTANSTGTMTYTCEKCHDTKTEVIPKLTCTFHIWDLGTVTKNPTYSETGCKVYTCIKCNTEKTETIAKKTVPTTKIISLKNGLFRKMTVKWRKVNGVSGYQIKYSGAGVNKTISVNGSNNVSKTIGSLSIGKTYKVSVRSYITFEGKKYYSKWSSNKNIRIKL